MMREEENQELFGTDDAECFITEFESILDANEKFSNRHTGFSNIDSEFPKFLPGVYILGGLPAVGKTTFTLQLLDQMARQGETCIYCSYEMESGYLYSKLLAREMFLIESGGFNEDIQHFNHDVKYPLPASKISFGKFDGHEAAYQQALKNFTERNIDLYIWELAEVNVDKLLNKISRICDQLDKPPVVVIDYFQLFGKGEENSKAKLDDALSKIINFRRETNTTFILISSLNRTSYSKGFGGDDISFSHFAGTERIENSSDVIWALKFKQNHRIENILQRNERWIEFVCLKNRFGKTFACDFNYFANVDYFQPYAKCVKADRGEI